MHLVRPKVYLVGYTGIDRQGLYAYLHDTGNASFIQEIEEAIAGGVSEGEALCSFYGKLCYQAISVGHNDNVTRVRSICDNVRDGILGAGHGSVLEHVQLNFVVRNCSRIMTHEQVRHRQGYAYSQESGRYCRSDDFGFVWDPILKPVETHGLDFLQATQDFYNRMVDRCGLNGREGIARGLTQEVLIDDRIQRVAPTPEQIEEHVALFLKPIGIADPDNIPFSIKKRLTSALRRFLPNGIANELGFSVNLRALRHTIMMRTAVGAEREIREVWGQVYEIVKEKYPLMVSDAKVRTVGGLTEVYGMRTQPYEEKPVPHPPVARLATAYNKDPGCWYCRKVEGCDAISHEFDTDLHLACLREAIALNDPRDDETAIIAEELKALLEPKTDG